MRQRRKIVIDRCIQIKCGELLIVGTVWKLCLAFFNQGIRPHLLSFNIEDFKENSKNTNSQSVT